MKEKWEGIKSNPVLYGLVNAVSCLVGLLIVYFVLSLIQKVPFTQKIGETRSLILLIGGPVFSFISSFLKAKNKDKKEM